MNYLITGATGLLGNNVLRMLLTEENSATVTVGAGDPRPLDGLNVEKVEIDLAKDVPSWGKKFQTALEGIDIVIHCGCFELFLSRKKGLLFV